MGGEESPIQSRYATMVSFYVQLDSGKETILRLQSELQSNSSAEVSSGSGQHMEELRDCIQQVRDCITELAVPWTHLS